MRCVVIVVVMMIGVIVSVLMRYRMSNRLQKTIQMRCRREVKGNVMEVESEQSRDQHATPPTCLG